METRRGAVAGGRETRRDPVIGPTQALRGRPGGPGVDVPPGAVPGLLGHGRSTGWQLAHRVWEDSGVTWEAPADGPAPHPYATDAQYATDYPRAADAVAADEADQLAAAGYPSDPRPTRHDLPVLRNPGVSSRVLPRPAAPDPAESGAGMGPWPVQPAPAPRPRPAAPALVPAGSADRRDGDRDRDEPGNQAPGQSAGPASADRDLAPAPPPLPRRIPGATTGWNQKLPAPVPAQPAAPDSGDQDLAPAPPLPRRIRRASEGWNEIPSGAPERPAAGGRGGQAPPLPAPLAAPSSRFDRSSFAPASPFTPSPAFASPRSYGSSRAYDEPPAFDDQQPYDGQRQPYDDEQPYDDRQPYDDHRSHGKHQPHGAPQPPGAPRGFAAVPLSAPVAPPLSEPDELFRAWQGSVDKAAGRRASQTARRPAATGARRQLGWQVAKIGVPAVVIVTVGAGALMMLTGRANEMLAERASNGALSSGKPTSGPVASGQTSGGPSSAGPVSMTLVGYPAEHGPVAVAALWSAGGTTMAVGNADGHPAVWRHAADGTWSLVSTAALGGITGRLTSVAQGTSGWIAVGSVDENGTSAPAVFISADGVSWQHATALTAVAGSGAQFLGVAAGPGGYLVVGKQGTGSQASVALWWSRDLQNWVNGENNGPAGSFADAAVATAGGFVAVGSENNGHTLWTSADGQHWTAHDLAKPAGATTAALTAVAAGQGAQGDRFVAAGAATTSTGEIPIVVTAANDGTHISQTVLGSPGGPAAVTAVTATAHGFVAVGTAGPANARHAVTWTSQEGRLWTQAAALQAAGTSEVTAATETAGTTVTATAQDGADPAILTVPAP